MKPRRTARALAAGLLLLATTIACAETRQITEPAQRGRLVVSLGSVLAQDRALLLELAGADLAEVAAAQPGLTIESRSVGGVRWIAVFGPLDIGALLVLESEPEEKEPGEPPSVTLLEVAGPDGVLRDLAGYTVDIRFDEHVP